jgi:hypothetical protein
MCDSLSDEPKVDGIVPSAVGVMARGGKKFRTVMEVGRGAFLVCDGIIHGLKLKSLVQGSWGQGKHSGQSSS